MIKVVNKKVERGDIYIGRKQEGMHYGNPFTHRKIGTLAAVVVKDRHEAVARFESWLRGTSDNDVEQERRAWILSHLSELLNNSLECFCAPLECHGNILAIMAEENNDILSNVINDIRKLGFVAHKREYPKGTFYVVAGTCEENNDDIKAIKNAIGIDYNDINWMITSTWPGQIGADYIKKDYDSMIQLVIELLNSKK